MGRMSGIAAQIVRENNNICPYCGGYLTGMFLGKNYSFNYLAHEPDFCEKKKDYLIRKEREETIIAENLVSSLIQLGELSDFVYNE